MTARRLGRGRVLPSSPAPRLKTLKSVKGSPWSLSRGRRAAAHSGLLWALRVKGALDTEGGGDGEHGLSKVEHGAQDQHLSWGGPALSLLGAPTAFLNSLGTPDPPSTSPPEGLGSQGDRIHPESAPSVMEDCFHSPRGQ